MEIQWKNIVLAMIILFLLIHLATIVNTVAGIISDVLAAIDTTLPLFEAMLTGEREPRLMLWPGFAYC
jgi:amino acid permease